MGEGEYLNQPKTEPVFINPYPEKDFTIADYTNRRWKKLLADNNHFHHKQKYNYL